MLSTQILFYSESIQFKNIANNFFKKTLVCIVLFLSFLTTHLYSSVLSFIRILLLNLKRQIAIIYSFAITTLFFFGVDKIIIFELSVIFGIFFLFINNRHFSKPLLLFLSTISLGLFTLTINEIAVEFVKDIFSYFNVDYSQKYFAYIMESLCVISIFLILGFIPFSEWSMYLFATSKNTIKITSFIIPMFFSLFILCEMAQNMTPIVFAIFGSIICIYSCISIFTIHRITIILSHIITYFYGLQILSLYNKPSLNLLNNWIIIAFIILILNDNFIKTRASGYKDKQMRQIFFASFGDKIIGISCFVFILLDFLYICFALRIEQYDFLKITSLCCFACCIIKFIFYSLFYTGKNQILETKLAINYNKNIYEKIFQIAKNIISFVFVVYLYAISFLSNTNQGIQNIMLSYTRLFRPSLTFFVILLLFIVLSILSLIFISNIEQPKIIKSNTYSKVFLKIFNTFKVIVGIIRTICEDFAMEIRKYFVQMFNSTLPRKMSYILYNNHIYFYIFFLIQVIIVLTIECVIAS